MVFQVQTLVFQGGSEAFSVSFSKFHNFSKISIPLHITTPTLTYHASIHFTCPICPKKLSSEYMMQCYLSTWENPTIDTPNRANELVDSGCRGGAGFVRHPSPGPTDTVASSANTAILRRVANTQPFAKWTEYWIDRRRRRKWWIGWIG